MESTMLFSWSHILKNTTTLLLAAKRRNALIKESTHAIKKHEKKDKEYIDFRMQLQTFANEEQDERVDACTLLFTTILDSKMKANYENTEMYYKMDKEASLLCHEIEEYKERVWAEEKVLLKEGKWKTEEIPKDKLYELGIMVLLASENVPTFSEADFFEEPAEFIKMLQESGDSVLADLVFKETILKTNWLDKFLTEVF